MFTDRPEKTNFVEDVEIYCFLSTFVEIRSVVSEVM